MKGWNKITIEKQLSLHKQQNKDDRYNYMCEQFNALWYCWELEKYTINQNKQLNKYKQILDKIKEYVNKEISLIDKDLSECELTYSEKYNFENEKNKYINILELLEEIE
jgi:hypothetical protein